MKGTRLMLGLVLVSLAAVGLTAAVEGCGQGVPTCDSVCALGAESPDCTGTCTGLQSTCGTTFAPDFDSAVSAIAADAREGDLILTLGAGSVSQLAPQILNALNPQPLGPASLVDAR